MLRPSLSRPLARLALAALCLLPLLALRLSDPVAAQDGAGPATTYSVYLPLVRGSGGPSQPTPTTPTPPPPAPAQLALFMQATEGRKIAGPQIRVDASGGTHIAYYDAIPLAEGPGATYGYCPPPSSACGDPARWSFTPRIGTIVDEVQLQLTPQGQPRMVIGFHATSHNREVYLYAECNANCTAAEDSWAFAAIGQRSLGVFAPGSAEQPKRSFALDPQGRPGFVLFDDDYAVEPDHAGGYYISCQADCALPESWTEARFTYRDGGFNELIGQPVLRYTPSGAPAILAELYPLNGAGEPGIYYFTCVQDCGESGGHTWERTLVAERTSGAQPSWDLEINSQGQPRVLYFKYLSQADTTRHLYYIWCDAACDSSGSWRRTSVGLEDNEGIGADLVLDAQGHPRAAALTATSLGYIWCDAGCDTPQGWQGRVADTDEQMSADYPVPLPITCRAGIWDGYAPALALDATGAPVMAYDASYQASCQYSDPTDPTKPPRDEFREIWHSVRVVLGP
jgi:hypothetical protein